MSAYEIALTISAYAALFAWVRFALSYNRVKWWKSPEGRNVMTLALCLIVLIGTIAFNRLIPWVEVKYTLVALSLTGIAITGIWRTYQLRMAQKAAHAHTEASNKEGTQ